MKEQLRVILDIKPQPPDVHALTHVHPHMQKHSYTQADTICKKENNQNTIYVTSILSQQ